MRKLTLTVQILLGVILLVFGLNKFLQFMPNGEPMPEMGAFLGAIFTTGYLLPLIAVIEIGTGILFLINRYTALAAILLFPVMLNAFLAHLFLDPSGIGAAALVIAMNAFLFFAYRDKYMGFVKTVS